MSSKTPLGTSPSVLAKRNFVKPNPWCPKTNIEFDSWCDPDNPKAVLYKDVVKASTAIKNGISRTPLLKSKCCKEFGMELYYKLETVHRTGSFNERGALYSILRLNEEQRQKGIITASLGNWAMALAYHCQKLTIPLTVVLPVDTLVDFVDKCEEFEARVILHGKNLAEAKRHAFITANERGISYINGYDHPHVIAGSGTIAVEIIEQLPETDAILIPIGGGGLIAGISTVIKYLNPKILIYGIEPVKCCSFFKAMENERPYETAVENSIAKCLSVPTIGCNAFHTARSLIDKMVLVDDDWIARAITHFVEEEKLITEGAGATSLSALLAIPTVVPELKDKNVVCLVTGGNIDQITLPRSLARAKAIEGRLIKMTVTLPADEMRDRLKILSLISNVGANVLQCYIDKPWLTDDDYYNIQEDFDEFCDPDNPKIIKYEEVIEAAERIKPYVETNTPHVPSHMQRDFAIQLYYKLEFLQTTGCFKERGAVNALQLLPLDKKKIGVVIASLGNSAMGICYHAKKLNIPVIVVMPVTVSIVKIQKCVNYGAKVQVQGANLMESQKLARSIARDKGLTYFNGRDHPHILAGYGTVALEILEQLPYVDAIIVPVGSGGLAAATAAVVKHVKPKCLVYGVQPEMTPVFFKSLENCEPHTLPTQSTLAESITVTEIGVNAFANAQPLLDKMLLVNEDWLSRAILHLVEKERFVVEGAGACPLAAIIGNLVPELKLKTVVCVLTGGNIDTILLARCLDRGLAAEGRLVKFKVGIKDNSLAHAQLQRLLASGGYNVVRQFQDHVWVEDDVYSLEVKLVVETKGLEHALELKRVIERAYPCSSIFETELFNDRRTCPCYVRKCM